MPELFGRSLTPRELAARVGRTDQVVGRLRSFGGGPKELQNLQAVIQGSGT